MRRRSPEKASISVAREAANSSAEGLNASRVNEVDAKTNRRLSPTNKATSNGAVSQQVKKMSGRLVVDHSPKENSVFGTNGAMTSTPAVKPKAVHAAKQAAESNSCIIR